MYQTGKNAGEHGQTDNWVKSLEVWFPEKGDKAADILAGLESKAQDLIDQIEE